MHTVVLEAMRGAASVVSGMPDKWKSDVHGAVQISPQDWEILKSKSYWTPAQAREARTSIDKLINASLTLANVPPQPLSAEYIAAVMARVIAPCNWLVASNSGVQGLDGKQLASITGDDYPARKWVSPERLHHLILVFSMNFDVLPKQPTEEDQMIQEAMKE